MSRRMENTAAVAGLVGKLRCVRRGPRSCGHHRRSRQPAATVGFDEEAAPHASGRADWTLDRHRITRLVITQVGERFVAVRVGDRERGLAAADDDDTGSIAPVCSCRNG